MTNPKMKPCPNCGNIYTALYGYGDWGTTWHVECDECHYMGPGGNQLQAIREHNERFAARNPQFGENAA